MAERTFSEAIRSFHVPMDMEVERWPDDGHEPEVLAECTVTIQVCQECGHDFDGDYPLYRPWPCPTIRSLDEHCAHGSRLTIDPSRHSGAVCVEGTRITAENIAGAIAGGDDVGMTATDFEITEDMVRLCCWWQVKHLESTPKRGWTAWDRRMWNAWRDWATNATHSFAYGEPVNDPPEVQR